jgi:hypothetical protein
VKLMVAEQQRVKHSMKLSNEAKVWETEEIKRSKPPQV